MSISSDEHLIGVACVSIDFDRAKDHSFLILSSFSLNRKGMECRLVPADSMSHQVPAGRIRSCIISEQVIEGVRKSVFLQPFRPWFGDRGLAKRASTRSQLRWPRRG